MTTTSSTDALIERYFRNTPDAADSYHNDLQYHLQITTARDVLNAVESRMASSGIRRPYIDDTISHVINRLFGDTEARERIIAHRAAAERLASTPVPLTIDPAG